MKESGYEWGKGPQFGQNQGTYWRNVVAFFNFLYYNLVCKKNLPFKNFFYITPYLIIYTPLEILGSSPTGYFSVYRWKILEVFVYG